MVATIINLIGQLPVGGGWKCCKAAICKAAALLAGLKVAGDGPEEEKRPLIGCANCFWPRTRRWNSGSGGKCGQVASALIFITASCDGLRPLSRADRLDLHASPFTSGALSPTLGRETWLGSLAAHARVTGASLAVSLALASQFRRQFAARDDSFAVSK